MTSQVHNLRRGVKARLVIHLLMQRCASFLQKAGCITEPVWSLHLSLLLSAGLFVAGILMFSLNMALRHLAGIGGLSFLLPYGGIAFVLGWLALGFVAKRSDLF